MTYASLRSAAQHIARTGTLTPHQLAAFSALDQGLTDAQRQQFTELWRAQGSPAAPAPPNWLQPALAIIKEFEGCKLNAYLCPAGVWTIGWGTTRLIDRPVRDGDVITQELADDLLLADVERFGRELLALLPMAVTWPGHRVAALVSWAYNVGLGAVKTSTLRRRLLGGNGPATVIREELPRWDKADGKVQPGLPRRRAAEVALFIGKTAEQPAARPASFGNPLQVPWYAQMDSADRSQAARMCFSSSCAMLLQYLKPGTLKGSNGDDQYLKRVQQYGDTTSAAAQIRALSSFGIKAQFVQNADFGLIERQIAAGVPVPCGFLHRGPVDRPTGGGHWLIVVGHDPTHLVVHDPFGEADLVSGRTLGGVARFMRYSRQNFGKRWMVEPAGGTYRYAPGKGWAIIATRP